MKLATLTLITSLTLAACGGGGGDTVNRAGMEVQKIGNVPGPGACGVRDAFRVTSVAGVRLSQAATISGTTLTSLDRWLRQSAIPAIGNRGGGLVGIRVPAHYACRTRNSRPCARLSEHAKGNAIDISAFILADGTSLTVLGDWNGKNSALMRRLHTSACGPFRTVLGPNSDRHHQDHFHFDVAQHRGGGTYCR